MSNVFVIINEWTTAEGDGSEIVDAKFFDTEDSAHDALKLIAASYHRELGPDDTNVVLEGHSGHITFEEYYIQELTRAEL